MNKLSNLTAQNFLKCLEKKLLRFKINNFFLHLRVSCSGIQDICDARMGNSASHFGISDIFTWLGQNKNRVAYSH